MTERAAGMTEGAAGMTERAAGMTERAAGMTEGAVGMTGRGRRDYVHLAEKSLLPHGSSQVRHQQPSLPYKKDSFRYSRQKHPSCHSRR